MNATVPPDYWTDVKAILQLFFPQYFDPDSPSYIDPTLLDQLLAISDEFRPWCLPTSKQNFAQAMYVAYLISVQQETSTGQEIMVKAGPITSEKEGDITISYATTTTGANNSQSQRPSSDPWDAWNKLYQLCAKGAITTRFGRPQCP